MESKTEVQVSGSREMGGLSEVRNGKVSERIKALNCLIKEPNFSGDIKSKREILLPPAISELMKLGDLENASSNALFRVVNSILDESIEKSNEDIPMHVASVLKLIVQEIEQRVSEQADNVKKQSSLYKSREDRLHSKIKALENLATENTEKNEVIINQLQEIKIQKSKMEEQKKLDEQILIKLRKEKESCEIRILSLSEELAIAKKSYDENLLKLEAKAKETEDMLQKKILELNSLLTDSRRKLKEIEDTSESKWLGWKRKGQQYGNFIDSQLGSIQELRMASEFIKQEVSRIKNIFDEEFNHLALNLKCTMDAAQNYDGVLEENRKLRNEVQDFKGNIRIYCRIRPFLSQKSGRQTTIQYIGENGVLVIINPSKPGKDSCYRFKFNKVFGPATAQEEVFLEAQPLIRSVLDGYNICIFAYGQTGSGKTYTMTGPDATSIVDWGLNYRALNDLFNVSKKRCGNVAYEIGVQMVEICNEQVHDVLRGYSVHKRLGIWNTSQSNGLDVSDASIHLVNSITDILELINIGLVTRAVGATALNGRSIRSHSILIVHVRGTHLNTNSISHGCLHLVDLAGSDRIDHSEATGLRSLSSLGDVISALAQKSPHVPYQKSKLTQVLQSSLDRQAKILMFAQLDPDVESYSETLSTLKFAEKISGIELGAARDDEGHVFRELMEQVASLKDAVPKRYEEIRRLRSPKTNVSNERIGACSTKHGPHSPGRYSNGGLKRSQSHFGEKRSTFEKVVSGSDRINYRDKYSDAGSRESFSDFKHHREFLLQSKLAVVGGSGPENFALDIWLKHDSAHSSNKDPEDDIELFGLGDPDTEERLSDISDGVLSMGTETDGSINSIIEYTLFPETIKSAEEITQKTNMADILIESPVNLDQCRFPRRTNMADTLIESPVNLDQCRTPRSSPKKSSSKLPGSRKANVSSFAPKATKRWQ